MLLCKINLHSGSVSSIHDADAGPSAAYSEIHKEVCNILKDRQHTVHTVVPYKPACIFYIAHFPRQIERVTIKKYAMILTYYLHKPALLLIP